MCTNTKQIYTRSNVLRDGHLAVMDVPCGHCRECREQKSSSWLARSYAEYQDALSKGGFVWFDTLTYADATVPKVMFRKDESPRWRKENRFVNGRLHVVYLPDNFMMTFSRSHVRKFIQDLTHVLARSYGMSRSNWKYQIVSEYGGSEEWTHRPHYHILLFSKVPQSVLSPDRLKWIIRYLWQGCQDNRDFALAKNLGIKTKRLFRGLCDVKNTYATENGIVKGSKPMVYCSKYVHKDQNYIDHAKSQAFEEGLYDMAFDNEHAPFHSQSLGFGYTDLIQSKIDDFFKLGKMEIPSKLLGCTPKFIPIPEYYKRKMFMEQEITVDQFGDKHYHWKAKPGIGEEFFLSHVEDQLPRFAANLDSYCDPRNLHNVELPISPVDGRVLDPKGVFSDVQTLLDGRSIVDLAVYVRFYRGRVFSLDNDLSDLDLSKVTPRLLMLHKIQERTLSYIDAYDPSSRFIDRKIIDHAAVNENSHPLFRNFDILYRFILEIKNALSKHRDDAKTRKEELQIKYKTIKYGI